MSHFASDTAVSRTDDNRWSAQLSDLWNIGDNPNGGYLVATALQAMRQVGNHRDPMSVTTHFLRPGTGGAPAEIETELVRVGRSLSTVRGSLIQDGKERVHVLAAFCDLDAPPSDNPNDVRHHSLTLPPPDIPSPEHCLVRDGLEQGVNLPIANRVETLIHPQQAKAGQAGTSEVSGWIRLADGTPPDVISALLFTDAFPPSLFGLLGYIGWVPTIELTVHIRRHPAPGWCLGRFACTDLHDGRMVEDGALWDQTGALVAQSRQIGLLLS
jgi:acyl-CoA thioesterase